MKTNLSDRKISLKTLAIISTIVFVFLLGFSMSVQAYTIRQKELNSPVSQYLRENYGVNSIEEYEAKLEQEAWPNYSRQMEALASEYPELNLPQNYMQAGTSTYQPPTLKSEQPFYAVVLGEPVVSLQVFSLSGLSLLGLAAVPCIKKRKQLRQALILGIVVLCVFSVGYFVGFVSSQTGTITIEPGSFQTEASYVIFTDGTTIYARNGTTGAIDYSGTNAASVINSALSALTSGGKIFLKAATYEIGTTIYLKDFITLSGENHYATVLKATAAITVLDTPFTGGYVNQYIVIENLMVDGNGIATKGIHFPVWRGRIRNVEVRSVAGDSIHIEGNVNSAIENVIEDVVTQNVGMTTAGSAGIRLGTKATDNIIRRHIARDSDYGVYVGAAGNIITNSHYYGLNKNCIYIAPVEYVQIVNNYIEGSGEHCIFVAAGQHKSLLIADNVFTGEHYVNNTYDAIYFDGASGNWALGGTVIGNVLYRSSSIVSRYFINLNYPARMEVTDNKIYESADVGTAMINIANSQGNLIIKNNQGFVTENSGTATIPSGQTSVTVNHGLAGTPTVVIITGSTSDTADAYVSAKTSTTFTITVPSPVGGDRTVYWYAEYKP